MASVLMPRCTPSHPRLPHVPVLLIGTVISLIGVAGMSVGAVVAAAAPTGPLTTAAWRVFFVACLFGLIALMSKRATTGLCAAMLEPRVLLGGLAFAATLPCWYASQRLSGVATAGVLLTLAPAIMFLVAWLVWRRQPRPLVLAGLGLAIAGVAVLFHLGENQAVQSSRLGHLLGLAAAICYATYFLRIGAVAAKLPFAALMCAVNLSASLVDSL